MSDDYVVIVTSMEAPPFADDGHNFVSRRQLLRLAGSAGLATTVGACSSGTAARPAPDPVGPSPSTSAPAARVPTTADQTAGVPPETTAAPLQGLTTAPAQLLCRDAWGAQPARPGGKHQTITRLTLHHSGVVLDDNRNAPTRFRQDQRYHQDQLGWIDIAYHLGVDRNGNIYQLRDPQIAGDTATDYDTTGHFLVLCEGDFDKEAISEAQLQGAAVAFAWAAQTYHVAPGTLAGHRDLAQTACPGTNLYAHIASGDLKLRIAAILAAGGARVQSFCGPEAAARVAAIEAGY